MDEIERLRASRARLAAASVEGRRRLERALHDGVQQDLTALTVGLQLAHGEAALEELRAELHAALDRVRALADDVYPSVLDARGLADALRAVARRDRVRVRIESDGGRAGRDLEAVAFFACKELLARLDPGAEVTAAVRHSGDGLRVSLTGAGETLPVGTADLVEAFGGTVAGGSGRLSLSF